MTSPASDRQDAPTPSEADLERARDIVEGHNSFDPHTDLVLPTTDDLIDAIAAALASNPRPAGGRATGPTRPV